MLPALPRRLIGYGAYNLCFDNMLGRPANQPNGPDFFHALRQRAPCVNLVKVIVYRNAGIEGLNHFPDRREPLYTGDREINDYFLNNLRTLVDTAAGFNPKFWVQVCIFSYHSVAALTRDLNAPSGYDPIPPEQPENVPRELVVPPPPPPPPGKKPTMPNPIDNARWFFNPTGDARLHAQKQLVAVLGQTLRGCTNVIWELANELRISNQPGFDVDDRATVLWLNQMRDALRSNAGPDIHITTSTGINNETTLLRGVPLTVFDFHSGQWEVADHYTTGIPHAIQRAASYNPAGAVIINDDGITGGATGIPRNQPNVTAWAKTAFQNGVHYNTKAPYPPAEDFSAQQIAALTDANNSVK
jgi:hypothetical protein